MSDYKTTCETGEQGELEVIEFLTSQLPGVKFIKFTSQKDQRFKGDYEMILSNEKKILIEIKTEEDDVWHNLFLKSQAVPTQKNTAWLWRDWWKLVRVESRPAPAGGQPLSRRPGRAGRPPHRAAPPA